MITDILRSKKGFTVTEVVFVVAITFIVILAVIAAWTFTYQLWVSGSQQMHLRVDLLIAQETMKNDIRLSSMTYMVFYPEDELTYTAVSMPIAETDANGFYTLDVNGNIEWDQTVIYHAHTDLDGNKFLRRTVFDPRDNTLTDEERYNQLEAVALDGDDINEVGVTDEDFLENLEIFEVAHLSPIIDFYSDSSTPEKIGKTVFGWIKLTSGDHDIRFEIIGKNDASSGFDIGIDSIMLEPSGASSREMEYYDSSFAPGGSIAVSGGSVSLVNDSIWNNSNYLEFTASAPGDYVEITDYYDLIRESSFLTSSLNNVGLEGDEVRASLEVPADDEDGSFTWFAFGETADSQQEGRDGNILGGVTPPVVIRSVVTSDNIDDDGDLIRVSFNSSSTESLTIDRAYITKRNGTSGANGLLNANPSGLDPEDYHNHQQLFFRNDSGDIVEGITIDADSEEWSVWTAFPLRGDSDYFISFYISDPASDECKYWEASSVANRTYYLVGATHATMAGTPDWSTESPSTSSNIYVTGIIDTWNTTGHIESGIYDTTLSNPSYNELKWSEVKPAGTDIVLKARSSDDEYMTGATDWDLITGSNVNPHTLSIGNGRYFQFLAELSTEVFWEAPGEQLTYEEYVEEQRLLPVYSFPEDSGDFLITGVYSTWADDVEIDWPGAERICTITGYVAKKDSYGQAKILVDGEELSKILSVKIKTSVQTHDQLEEAENIIEMEPRNTGK